MNQENTETKCPGFGLPTDEPNPNGSLHARLNWHKNQADEYADALQGRVYSNPVPPPFNGNAYIPKSWSISKDDIYDARDAIAIGLAHTKEALERHDTMCGAGSLKDKLWTEKLKKDITQMEDVLQVFEQIPMRLMKAEMKALP